ncbi:unnamed protein product [Caenorhabditis auriculariae]|uniref:tRNA pseudouridine synthase n=1 Tax=Caenorhabditis auriculariae TaxID=2777116 RepID=A0A8S1HLM1_9PELO|nr:unnamed protein product [Caenorhabditis auriculariae]
MARGGTGFGVMDLLKQVVSENMFGPRNSQNPLASSLRFAPSSRTDAGVHALRNSVICQVPLEFANLDENETRKKESLTRWNRAISAVSPEAMSILDVHRVSAGFCARRNVSYRRYTYRLAVGRDWDLWESIREDPTLACFSEQHYAWRIPPGFDPSKLAQAAKLFQGVHVMGSFFKHGEREKRKEPVTPNAIKSILHVGIYPGEPYSYENDIYDYYNVTIVAKSFVREQIRRMMSCLVNHAYGRLPLEKIVWLLKNPISSNFYDNRIPVAPAQGLFLTDIVYEPEHFKNPVPYHYHSWDYVD